MSLSSASSPSRLNSSDKPYTFTTHSSAGIPVASREQPHQHDSMTFDDSFSLIHTIGDILRSIRNWFIKTWDSILSYFFPPVPAEHAQDNFDANPLDPRSHSTHQQTPATHPIASSASQPSSFSNSVPQIDEDPISSDSDQDPTFNESPLENVISNEDAISEKEELSSSLSHDELECRMCDQAEQLIEYFKNSHMDLNKLDLYRPAGHIQDPEDEVFPIDSQDWISMDLSLFDKPTHFTITTKERLESQAIVWPILILEQSKESRSYWKKGYLLFENHISEKNPSLNWICSISNNSKESVSLEWVLTLAKQSRQQDAQGNRYKLSIE